MRIIAGDRKGHQLKPVPGKTTRPTTDKVREAVFQVIGPFFDGGLCLDLFAGSGAMGIEALSRGIDKTIFIDQHPKAIETIKDNLVASRLTEYADVKRADAWQFLQQHGQSGQQFDLIVLDPPYEKIDLVPFLQAIEANDLLRDDAFVYCEHASSLLLTDQFESLDLFKQQNYGGTIGVTIFRKVPRAEDINGK